ncbi:MAG TPA: polysaccharide biosynthesis/export family protein [Pirellulaceae bacterium]|nr:polysaccharide biosynthesis/export family protein [Pirellulaceae bacterium]
MRPLQCLLTITVLGVICGCHYHPKREAPPPFDPIPPQAGFLPRELNKTVLPIYTIEPPDILVIEGLHILPKAPYHLRTGDVLGIQVTGTLPDAPIMGPYQVQPGGVVNLGPPYGSINVAGKTIEEVQTILEQHLKMQLQMPVVSVSLVEISGQQQIAGQHLVKSDGTVTLGSYGSVPVVGLTLEDAKHAIEEHLSRFLDQPEVAVDVFAFNSKVYYIVTEGAGLGDGVTKWPITGNDTVLDAIANIQGLTEVSSKKIWIARPVPHAEQVQILPVDWTAITAQAAAETNYQIMPGDRVFVAEDKMVALDTGLGKFLAPFERAMGFTLLSTNTATRLSGKVLRGGGNPGNFGSGN